MPTQSKSTAKIKTTIRISQRHIDIATQIGQGNLSYGIRSLIEQSAQYKMIEREAIKAQLYNKNASTRQHSALLRRIYALTSQSNQPIITFSTKPLHPIWQLMTPEQVKLSYLRDRIEKGNRFWYYEDQDMNQPELVADLNRAKEQWHVSVDELHTMHGLIGHAKVQGYYKDINGQPKPYHAPYMPNANHSTPNQSHQYDYYGHSEEYPLNSQDLLPISAYEQNDLNLIDERLDLEETIFSL